jgi:hypothetical protein
LSANKQKQNHRNIHAYTTIALILCCAPTAAGRIVALVVLKGNLDKVFQQFPDASKPEGMTHAVLAIARVGKRRHPKEVQTSAEHVLEELEKSEEARAGAHEICLLSQRRVAVQDYVTSRLAAPFWLKYTGPRVRVCLMQSACLSVHNVNSIESVCVHV